MSKYLLITDTHLGLYNDSDQWIDIVVNFFKDIVKYCYKNNIKEIIHLGDFFHNRKALNTKTQHAAHRIAKILSAVPDLHTKIIVGNHDCYYKNLVHPNTLELFKKYEHIEVIDEVKLHEDILLVPWGLWNSEISMDNVKYIFGHFAIKGFHMNDSYVCKDGLNKDDFNGIMVLSGHFHTPSKQGNIIYLGSGYGQTMHDAGGIRGFHTFEDGKLNFIEYRNAPSFVKVNTSKLENIDLESLRGNVVKLIFDEDHGSIQNQKIVDGILKSDPMIMKIDFTKVSSEGDEEQEEILDKKIENRGELVDSYIDLQEFPSNIQPKMLKAMFHKLMREAEIK